jgi:hypothetical protein
MVSVSMSCPMGRDKPVCTAWGTTAHLFGYPAVRGKRQLFEDALFDSPLAALDLTLLQVLFS